MKSFLGTVLLLFAAARNTTAQQQDYYGGDNDSYGQDSYGGDDTLYHDYAMKQQEKEIGTAAGPGWGKIAAGTAAGWLIGAKFHCSRKEKKLNARHKEEQKALYTQYYNDVYTLQQQNTELAQALEQLGVRVH